MVWVDRRVWELSTLQRKVVGATSAGPTLPQRRLGALRLPRPFRSLGSSILLLGFRVPGASVAPILRARVPR